MSCKRLDCCAQGHSQCSKFQLMFVGTVSSELLNFFVTGFGRVMHRYEQECHANRLLSSRSRSQSSYSRNMTVSVIYSGLLSISIKT